MNKLVNSIKPVKSNKIVNIIAAVCASVLIISCFCAFMPINGEQKIYSGIIRLHILANSDSEEDQNLKLEVRDYILGDIAALTKDSANVNDASAKIQNGIRDIENKAEDFIIQKGYNYSVTAALSKEIYPERTYTDENGEDFIFPSGKYNSLRIFIGAGKGKNWWCVLFPPICLAGSKVEDELSVAGYSNDQIQILKKDKNTKYVIRFKILEVLEGLFK